VTSGSSHLAPAPAPRACGPRAGEWPDSIGRGGGGQGGGRGASAI